MEKKNQVPKYPPLRFPEFTDEWKKVKLGEVADYVQKRGRCRLYLSTENMLPDFQGIQECLLEQATSGILFQAGDVLVSNIRPYLRKAWLANKAGCCSADVLVFRHKSLLDPMFFYYIMANQKFIDYMMRAAKGVKMPRGDKGHVIQYPLRLPSISEQHKIAALFSLIDERIEVQNAIIKEREAQKAALLRRLFDRTLRFPEFTDEWKEYQNSEVFEIISEKNTDLRDSNVVSASMNYGVVLRDEIGVDIKYEQESIRGYKVVRDGDYIVHLRSFQGGFAFSRLNGICSPAYTILRPRSNMLEYGFLESYFCSSRFITSLKRVTYGIRDGRSISVEEWMSEKTSLPTLAEQKKIAALLSAIDERIAVEKEYAALLQKQKAYLLRQMFV